MSVPQPPRILSHFQKFFATESSSGLLLLGCTVVALAWANSPWAASYFALWHEELTLGFPGWNLTLDLHHWINDGLMALFFFVVGLEIKRELLVGELSQLRQAALPVIGALGGMLLPGLFYLAVNPGGAAARGWAIPVATDIAFALAILSLLGPRIPTGLKVFLVALAIVDDLGAVVVIALFYTSELNVGALALAAAGLALALLLNRWRVISPLPYALVGIVVWLAVLDSGVHATVSGVLLALCIPAHSRIDVGAFHRHCRELLARFEHTINPAPGEQPLPSQMLRLSGRQQELVGGIEEYCEAVQPPLDRLEHALHPWIAFLIMPLFALANAGVTLPSSLGSLLHPVSLGILLGLVAGKQLGVFAFTWLAVRYRLAVLPEGVSWRQLYGAAWVCGVGFTMSLFITNLAFGNDAELQAAAKLGILLASLAAGLVGYVLLRQSTRPAAHSGESV
jgi:NhaA family Na+:H+ antiporter